jgi:hypothetical protein
MIPAGRIAPFARKFLDQFVPAPNTSEPGINYAAREPRRRSLRTSMWPASTTPFRLRDTFSGSYIRNVQADLTVPVFQFDTRGNSAPAQNLSLSEVHIFSPSIVNEARAGWHRFFEHEFFGSTDHPEFDVGNIIGIPGVSKDPRNYGPPTFTAGYTLPSVRTNGPRDRLNQLWQVTDNISIQGPHNLKAGALVARRN